MNPTVETLNSSSITSTSGKIKLLYDGECPLCLREVNFLQKRDAGRGLIAFVNISEINYRPEDHGGISFEAAMGRIHLSSSVETPTEPVIRSVVRGNRGRVLCCIQVTILFVNHCAI
ncbi:thiol-disulfide oxidoreductase DCC family protein, partial [Planktothrix mougeotii]